MNSEQPSQQPESSSLADLVLDLNFVPAWARNEYQPAGRTETETEPHSRERSRRKNRIQRHLPKRGGAAQERQPGDSRRAREPRDRRVEQLEENQLPVRVRFVPERTALGTAARDLHISKRAASLMQLSLAFMSGENSCEVKIELPAPSENIKPINFLYLCKVCQQVFCEYSGAFAHVTSAHLDLHFRREERVSPPPSGQFTCVGRCRLSGELLGPPNHHAYNERLMDLYRRRFSHLSLDEYRQQIEMVRDASVIEQWRQEACKQEVYFALDERDGVGELSRREAERVFAERYTKGLIRETRHALIPRKVAMGLEDLVLARAVRQQAERERARPFSMMLALRAAFHHMRFHLFHARGQTFVTAVEPRPLNPTHAIRSVAEVLEFLQKYPGCTRHDVIAGLRPGLALDSAEVSELLRHLAWLVDKGHIIEFYNGTLAVPQAARHAERGNPQRAGSK